jgi:putative transposase
MPPKAKHTEIEGVSQSEFHEYMHTQMRQALRVRLSSILAEELTAFIGAGRYEQKAGRREQRNGSYARDLVTSVGKIEGLEVPRRRQGYQTQVFARYHRRQSAPRGHPDRAMLQMFVGGVSTPQVGGVIHEVTGQPPSASTVSRVFHTLEAAYAVWKTRP